MRINRTLGLALTAAVLAVAMTGCSNSASSTASSAASSEAASSVAASSEVAESEAAAASVVSTEDLDVNGTTYSADCYGEFTLSNGDTMKLWKVKDAYADLSALPMKGMAEEFPIEAEAEQIRRRAKGEADAILAKMQAEAQGAQEILVKQADGLRQIVAAAGGDADHAVRLMLADKMEELMRIQVDAVKGIKLDKVTVWDGGEQKDGKTATAGFVSGLMKSIPPMNEMFDMAGMELPRFLGKNKEEPAAPPAPAAEPGAPAEES